MDLLRYTFVCVKADGGWAKYPSMWCLGGQQPPPTKLSQGLANIVLPLGGEPPLTLYSSLSKQKQTFFESTILLGLRYCLFNYIEFFYIYECFILKLVCGWSVYMYSVSNFLERERERERVKTLLLGICSWKMKLSFFANKRKLDGGFLLDYSVKIHNPSLGR